MFDLRRNDDAEVQQAVTVATGDRVTDSAGREWIVTSHNATTMGESFIWLDRSDDRSEERGVPVAAFFDEYEIVETDEPQSKLCIGWQCCCCNWRQYDPDNEPDHCPECRSGQLRRRYQTRGRGR